MASDLWTELLQATIAVTLAIVIVLVARRPLRAWFGARAAYALWALVPMSMIATWLPPLAGRANDVTTGITATAWMRFPESLATAATPASPWLPVAIWFIGAAALALVLALRQRQFLQRVHRRAGQPHDESDWATPAVAGLLRPRIVLPTDFRERYSESEQRLVLAHESLHVARGDIPAQALATVMRCVFWFHPLVHWAAVRFRFDQELACDADVIQRHPESRRTYGDAMLKTQLAEFGLPLGCHWQSIHPLKERIAMLKHPLPGALRRHSGSFLLTALLSIATVAAWASQPATAPEPAKATPLQSLTDDDVLTAPKYPASAMREGISGRVVLDVLVGTDGRPTDVKVVKAEPAGVFDEMAVEAARKWQFNAGRNGARGEKVEGWVRVPVDFKADEKPAE